MCQYALNAKAGCDMLIFRVILNERYIFEYCDEQT